MIYFGKEPGNWPKTEDWGSPKCRWHYCIASLNKTTWLIASWKSGQPLTARYKCLITQQKTLTTHLFSLSLLPTPTFTYKPNRNAPVTAFHPHFQSHYYSNYKSQYRPEHHYIRLNFKASLDSEEDFRSGCWNVGHYEQSFSGLLSPGRSNSFEVRNSKYGKRFCLNEVTAQ